ncbi:thiamine pyrophosphokinase [Mucilaginibacter sp. AW1-3]
MSSHHIVREKQEPALLILGMEHFTDELLGQLLEWSPTIVVTAGIAEKLNAAGIKMDVIVGSSAHPEDIQSDIQYVRASDNSETVTALNYLLERNYPAVNVVTDVFELNDYLAFADRINLVIYCANKKIYPVHSGFSKWKPAGEAIELLSPAQNIAITGLNKVADGSYITQADGFFSLQFEGPYLLIAENIL